MHHVVITGVSTGIGYATAEELIAEGTHVFGSVRKAGDATRLCAALGEAFTPLYFDVTVEPAVQAAAQVVRERLAGATLFGLVNNAGIAVAGPLLHVPLDQVRQQLEVNIVGQLIVTQAFAPLLGADRHYNRRPGRIVMVSSISGRNGLPFLGPYAASKHGLEGMAESLRRELMLYGIDVIIVGPGAVATPIWDKAENIDPTPYLNTDYAAILPAFQRVAIQDGRNGLPPERVAAAIARALTDPQPPVRIPVVKNRLMNWVLSTGAPKRWVDRMIAGRLGIGGKDKG